MATTFNIGTVIYPIKRSQAYNMTQLKNVIKVEVVELNGKLAKVKLISIKNPLHPNKDGSPINSLLASYASIDHNINIVEEEVVVVFTKDFYKKKEDISFEYGKYPAIYYLEILKKFIIYDY